MTARKSNGKRPLWAVTGGAGLFGRAILKELTDHGDRAVALVHGTPSDLAEIEQHRIDITDPLAVLATVDALAPDIIVHGAAMTSVDQCESQPEQAMAINADGAANMARAAHKAGAKCIHISTDHLWDGETPFIDETVPPHPINVYARSKARAEEYVTREAADALIVRTTFYGSGHPTRRSLSDAVIGAVSHGRVFNGFTDSFFTPLALGQLIPLIFGLTERNASGIYNLGSGDRLSKYEFAKRVCRRAGFDENLVQAAETKDAALAAPRPRDLSLSSAKAEKLLGHPMPNVDAGIAMVLEGAFGADGIAPRAANR